MRTRRRSLTAKIANPLLINEPVQRQKTWVEKWFPLLKKPKMLITLVLYIVSGVFQPIVMDVLKNNGAGEIESFLSYLPVYFGLAIAIVFYPGALKVGKVPWKWVLLLDSIDVVAIGSCYAGNFLAGSLVYTTIYSSVTIWCALFSVLFLRKRLVPLQWLGCLFVTGGVSLTAIDSAENEKSTIFIGAIVLLIGTMLHSSTYILSDFVLHSENPIKGELLCTLNGAFGFTVFAIWVLAYTVPRWDELITQHVHEKNGSWTVIGLTLAATTVLALVHAVTFFRTIKQMGAVTAAVCKGLQACGVFVVAHVCFCHVDKTQCFTPSKGISFGVVIFGTLVYTLGTLRKEKQKAPLANTDYALMDESSFPSATNDRERKSSGSSDGGVQKNLLTSF